MIFLEIFLFDLNCSHFLHCNYAALQLLFVLQLLLLHCIYWCVDGGGGNTRCGLDVASKAQTVFSHSTTEAEVVSADYGL